MYRYIIKRLLMLIPVLLCVAFIIFAIMDVADGDPVYSVVSADATEEEIKQFRQNWRLAIYKNKIKPIERIMNYHSNFFPEFFFEHH